MLVTFDYHVADSSQPPYTAIERRDSNGDSQRIADIYHSPEWDEAAITEAVLSHLRGGGIEDMGDEDEDFPEDTRERDEYEAASERIANIREEI